MSTEKLFEILLGYFDADPGGLINHFWKRSAQRRMSTEKLFEILKKSARFQMLSSYYFLNQHLRWN